jgi:hypothetical protein
MLLSRLEFIRGKKFTIFNLDSALRSELRSEEFTDGDRKVVSVSYGYYAGKGENATSVALDVTKLLIVVFHALRRESQVHQMRVQMENYRLRGQTRSCIFEEFEDDRFIEDEDWDVKVEARIENQLRKLILSEGSPFRINYTGDVSLADYYVADLKSSKDDKVFVRKAFEPAACLTSQKRLCVQNEDIDDDHNKRIRRSRSTEMLQKSPANACHFPKPSKSSSHSASDSSSSASDSSISISKSSSHVSDSSGSASATRSPTSKNTSTSSLTNWFRAPSKLNRESTFDTLKNPFLKYFV